MPSDLGEAIQTTPKGSLERINFTSNYSTIKDAIKMRLILYCRCSTEEQQTIENQREIMVDYCKLYGHEVVEVFMDEGASGKDLNRSGLQAALESINCPDVDGIIITKLDRLSRSIRDWCNLMEGFEYEGKTLVSVVDRIDTSTAAGRMVANLFAVFAQFERETIQERTITAMRYLRKKGRRLSARIPFGFRVDPSDESHLVPCLQETPILNMISELHDDGMGYADIARRLNEKGIPARTKTWNRSTVWKILKRQEEMV